MDFDTAIKVCSILVTVLYGIGSLYSLIDFILCIFYIPSFISLIFLTIGVFKGKLSYMKQFIYVFLIKFIIIGILLIISLFIVLFVKNKNTTHDVGVRKLLIIIIAIVLIFYCLELYYYICVGSYIQSFVEDFERSIEAKKLESAENEIKSRQK
jgi:hypothetical protein